MIDKKSIESQHRHGLSGLVATYSLNNLFRGLRLSLPIAIALFLLIQYGGSSKKSFEIISDICSLAISIIPNLLGFMLGGYAILISFGNVDILKQLAELKEKGGSLYQQLSSIFAFCLVVQGYSLLYYAILSIIIKLEIKSPDFEIVNDIGVFFTLFTLIYAICSIIDVIINVFSFSQYHHWRLIMEKKVDEKNKIEAEKKLAERKKK